MLIGTYIYIYDKVNEKNATKKTKTKQKKHLQA